MKIEWYWIMRKGWLFYGARRVKRMMLNTYVNIDAFLDDDDDYVGVHIFNTTFFLSYTRTLSRQIIC